MNIDDRKEVLKSLDINGVSSSLAVVDKKFGFPETCYAVLDLK